MILRDELAIIQDNYKKNPMQNIRLKRPAWLRNNDPMSAIYKDKRILLEKGSLSVASVVQANTILFRFFPHQDCPAHIVYSTSPFVLENPEILWDIAHSLYFYKNKPLSSVPEEWREIARVITDEYDRSAFTFPVYCNEQPVEIHLIPVMIFRKLLPRRKLCGNLLPILTAPESKTVLILPKRFWTEEFKEAWCNGRI